VRSHAPAACWVARGTLLVTDNDVEVATSSSVIDPVVEPRLEGMLAIFSAEQRAAGLGAAIEFEAALRSGPPRSIELGSLGASRLDLLPMRVSRDARVIPALGATLRALLGQAEGSNGLGAILELK
jgi:hypothetical protein